MEVIHFQSGNCVYRHQGDHSFVAGQDCVVSVSPTLVSLPRALTSLTRAVPKNICGKFMTYLESFPQHVSVSAAGPTSYFGRHRRLFHVHGSVTVYRGVAFFKGCPGYASVCALSQDLFLESPRCEVHMGVFKCCLGRRIDTERGPLQRCVEDRFRGVRVVNRILDNTQAVKMRIQAFSEEEFPYLSGRMAPTSVDLSVCTTGVLLLRFSWSRLPWTEEAEATTLRFCDWMAKELRSCC